MFEPFFRDRRDPPAAVRFYPIAEGRLIALITQDADVQDITIKNESHPMPLAFSPLFAGTTWIGLRSVCQLEVGATGKALARNALGLWLAIRSHQRRADARTSKIRKRPMQETMTRMKNSKKPGTKRMARRKSEVPRVRPKIHEIALAASESGAQWIVIATHGYTGLKHVYLGSTAERVVRHAPCPVLVVREADRKSL